MAHAMSEVGTIAGSVRGRCDVPEFDRCEIGRDAYPHAQRAVGIGGGIVASIWLAFYLMAFFQAWLWAIEIEARQ
jgi:hypothetical protein